MEKKILPDAFSTKMKQILGTDYDAFEQALLDERSYGLRFNPLKVDRDRWDVLGQLLGVISAVPWAEEGFYYNQDAKPGKSVFHEAGAIYIQEPSAMSVVTALDPKPGERICDLCAAPGGKTTHIAGKMNGEGILVSNEIMTDRARILARNVERLGIKNCIVTNADPQTMANNFPGYFHKMVVDAPCSGEGMFRKDDTAIEEWSEYNVSLCIERQKEILDCAAQMIMPGGTIVYSTCTYEPGEDEGMIADFLENHTDWHLVDAGVDGLSYGLQISDNVDSEYVRRLWPHLQKGEGHFLAKLVRDGIYLLDENKVALNAKNKNSNAKTYEEALRFLHTKLFSESFLADIDTKNMYLSGDNICLLPKGFADNYLKRLKTIRTGLELLVRCKDRFEPAHALAVALKKDEAKYSFECDRQEAIKYLRGETVNITPGEIPNGEWVLVCYEGLSMGWAKHVNGVLKNHYPKGLRRDLE